LTATGEWPPCFAPNFSFICASAVFVGEDGVPGVHRLGHRTPSAQRRKTLSKQGIATVQATALAPESGPEYDLLNDEFKKSPNRPYEFTKDVWDILYYNKR